MKLHAAIHWSDVADPTLWPMAVRQACWIWNHLQNHTTGLSPEDVWSRTRYELRHLHRLHVWNSPVYVLQKKIADGKKVGRWEPRSQPCIYLGFSLDHAKDVPLVLNPATESITAQWNVVFDDWFATISSSEQDLPDFNVEDWSNMFGATTSHVPDEIPSEDEPGQLDDAPRLLQQKSTNFAPQFRFQSPQN